MELLRADRLRIAYERAGDGPPLVLAHGAVSDGRVWRSQLRGLADEFTVVAWDEPGTGRSSDPPDGFSLADYAHALAALVEEVGLGPAHVAGLSWGATVVLELLRQHPDRVATPILVGGYAGWKGSLPLEEVQARLEGARAMLSAPSGRGHVTLPGLFAGEPPVEYASLLDEMAADVRPGTLWTQLSLMAEADLREVLSHIAQPTLLVWGELDVRSPVDPVARDLARAIPDATLVVLPRAGHVCNVERPEAFNAAVREFCHAHRPARR
jgi:pimeloyl-ACP methyl ester carboxylesterase